tara:strand:- start:3493 stop:4257 length:765 start_codon:yes stop_codon:yes gene_type:complete
MTIAKPNVDFRHSHSNAETFNKNRCKWVMENIYGYIGTKSDAMIRGSSAEFGCNEKLQNDDTNIEKVIKENFIERGGHDETELIFAQKCGQLMYEFLTEFQFKPTEYQMFLNSNGKEYGLKYPIVGYTDWLDSKNHKMVIDGKSTKRVMSKASHTATRQQGLYYGLSGKQWKFGLLYASNSKYNFIEIPKEELEEGFDTSIKLFKQIENEMTKYSTLKEWVNSCPYPNFDDWEWNYDEELKNLTKEIWRSLWQT